MTRVVKAALWLVGTGLVLGIVYLSYLAVTIIDDNVVEGSAYGFEIGRGKRESFNDAIAALASADMLIREGRGEEAGARIGQRVQFNLTPESLSVIEDQDVWEFYFDERYPDYLRLTFESGQLVEIRRHRQYFELP